MRESIYSFENQGRRKFTDKQSEDAALKEFAQRLGVTDSNYEESREILLNFILNFHKVIYRYKELRSKEMKRRFMFTFFSLVLLCLIPYLIFLIPLQGSTYLTQVTAMLTGLVAVHKSLSSWLDTRKIIGNFWRAESDLKSKLYTFEDRWRGQATEVATENAAKIDKLKDDFLKEARVAISEARMIVQNEQSQFFDAITYPSIDLFGTLKAVGADANTLISNYSGVSRGESVSGSGNFAGQRQAWGSNAKG